MTLGALKVEEGGQQPRHGVTPGSWKEYGNEFFPKVRRKESSTSETLF